MTKAQGKYLGKNENSPSRLNNDIDEKDLSRVNLKL